MGDLMTNVLCEYEIPRNSFYEWRWIGEGRLSTWWAGAPVNAADVARCRRLVLALAEARFDRARVELAGVLAMGSGPIEIAVEASGISNRQLLGQITWVDQEGPEKSDGGQLSGESQSGVSIASLVDDGAVAVIEVEEQGQLGWRGLAVVATVAALLVRNLAVLPGSKGRVRWRH